MASKAEAEKVCLECPICRDNFKDATLLTCGHTFCKGCLEKHDEQHNDDHLVCPVCRQSTELGPDRVSGLASVRENEDKSNVDDSDTVEVGDRAAYYCQIHNVDKDIVCLDCKIFICHTCYVDLHKYHKYEKVEEKSKILREHKDNITKRSETTKTQIQRYLDDASQEYKCIHRNLNILKEHIEDTFERKLAVLRENKELLLETLETIHVDDVRKQSDVYTQQLETINCNLTQLIDIISKSSDFNTLQACYKQFDEYKDALEQTIGNEPMVQLKQAAESLWFCPADENLLALGRIVEEAKATVGSVQKAKTATGERQNVDKLEASSTITEIPTSTHNLKILRKVEVPLVAGMAALSQDAVVVGQLKKPGAYCFYVSGDTKPHLRSEVGDVHDIALLTDGRSVVSNRKDTLLVYDKQGKQIRGMTYTCLDNGKHPRLCSDHHDNIYAINGNSKVFIFHGNKKKPKSDVPTGYIKPEQICVTRTGVIITSTCISKPSTVTVFDIEGLIGTSITASGDDEYLYATVDSHDRVLVAKVRKKSDTIGLTRYTLQGLKLIEEVMFNPLKLHSPCLSVTYCMVSLTPNMIAFANGESVYFIEIAA